jgi:D-alanine-D-alanine ligase
VTDREVSRSMSDSRWAVVFGGPSPEHEISILTGLQAERVLTGAGQDVVPLYWAPTGGWFLVPAGTEAKDYLDGVPSGAKAVDVRVGADGGLFVKGRLRSERLDVAAALSCLHGGLGEGGGFAGLFALLGIPATGSTLYASALGMDKLAFGGVMAAADIPTLPRVALEADVDPGFAGPYIVKPRYGGSSIGIEIVDDVATARVVARSSAHLRGGAVVEPFRKDLVDLNISFRTYPEVEVSDLERPLRRPDGAVYSYEEKYLGGSPGEAGLSSAPRELPAQVPDAVTAKAGELARRVAAVTRLTGVVRVDFLYDENSGELVVNEVNSVPGALSLYLWAPKHPAAQVLLDALVEARDTPPQAAPSGFGSGAALRAAGGIAGKLVGLDGPRL